MAQPSNQRREERAARRAREAAAAQERAAQAAKERKQQTIIGIIVSVVVLALLVVAGVAVYRSLHKDSTDNANAGIDQIEESYTTLQNVGTKPVHADDQSGILISKDGYGKAVEGVPTIGMYMDFLCPGCGSMHSNLDEDLLKMVNAGQINLDLHIMSFMDRLSSDEYSSRAANIVLYVADHDDNPEHLLKFIENLYKQSYQPEEGTSYEPTSDADIIAQADGTGIDQSVLDKASTRDYDEWLNATTDYTTKREELWNVSGSVKGGMTTPTLTVNGWFLDLNSADITQSDLLTALLKAIGLQADQIGVEGDLPSIGTGKPLIGADDSLDPSTVPSAELHEKYATTSSK